MIFLDGTGVLNLAPPTLTDLCDGVANDPNVLYCCDTGD